MQSTARRARTAPTLTYAPDIPGAGTSHTVPPPEGEARRIRRKVSDDAVRALFMSDDDPNQTWR